MGKHCGWLGLRIWISFRISSKLRQVFEQFCGYFKLLMGRVSAFSRARDTSECPTKLTMFQDLETSRDHLPCLSGWLKGRE